MDYIRLGSSGLKVSRICLGTMTYGTPAWRPWVLSEGIVEPAQMGLFSTVRNLFAPDPY